MNTEIFGRVVGAYQGSSGEATTALYTELDALGPAGEVGVNLFRACKASERAKRYRGGIRGKGSYRRMAYDRKHWALERLCAVLAEHGEALGLTWGWAHDPTTPVFCWVLYVELPCGQVSFHTDVRILGPDYRGRWDRVRGASADRICRWCARLLDGAATAEAAQ